MTTLKIGDKELKIKFGYEATLKTRLLSKLAKKENNNNDENANDGLESMEELFLFLPEFLLVGLQKYHSDEFGFDYTTGAGKDEQLNKVFGLIEEYFDSNENADAITLYNLLTEEMLQNGFLKSYFQKEVEKVKTEQNQK